MSEKKVESKDIIEPDLFADMRKSAEATLPQLAKLSEALAILHAETIKNLKANRDPKTAKEIKKTNELLSKGADIRKSLDSVEKQQASTKKQITTLTVAETKAKLRQQQQQKAIRDSLKDVIALEQKEIGTLQRVAIENKRLRKERERLNLDTDKGRQRLQEINRKLDDNNKLIRVNSDEMKKQRLNVGNYSTGIKEGIMQSGLFSTQLATLSRVQAVLTAITRKNTVEQEANTVATETNTVGVAANSTAQKGAAAASGGFSRALKILKYALIATGIGAVVVILGSLIAAFASTQRGADAFSRALAPIRVAFEKFVGFLQDTGFKVFDRLKEAFENPVQAIKDLGKAIVDNIVNRFTAISEIGLGLGKVLKGIFTRDLDLIKQGAKDVGEASLQAVTGIKDIGDKISSITGDISEGVAEATRQGNLLFELQKKYERLQIDTTVALSKAKLEMQEQNAIAKDGLKSDTERIAALNEAEKQLRFISNTEKKLLDLQIQKMELEQTFNDTDRAGELELEKLKAQRLEADARAQKKINGLIALRSGLEKKILLDKEKGSKLDDKAAADALKQDQERQKSFLDTVRQNEQEEIHLKETQLLQLKNLKEKGLKNDEDIAAKELEIQKAKLETIINNEASSYEERERAKAEYDAYVISTEKANADKLLAIDKAKKDKQFANTKELTSATGAELQKKTQLEQQQISQAINLNAESIALQQDLARSGAANQLAQEKEAQAKLLLQRKNAQEKEAREQEAIKLAERFIDAVKLRQNEQGANPSSVVPKAIADTFLIKGVAKGIAQFAKDGENMVMPNGEGGSVGVDDIPFYLTKQEAVIKRDANLGNPGVAMALNDGSFQDKYILKEAALRQMMSSSESNSDSGVAGRQAIALLKKIEAKPVQIIDITKQGEIIETLIKGGQNKKRVHKMRLRQ